MTILSKNTVQFDSHIPVAIIGAGACGLCAALAASDQGAEVIVLERDALPQGSTALSSGMIPAPGTLAQQALNIDDTPALMAADIQRKAHDEVNPKILQTVCSAAGPTLNWLVTEHQVDLTLVEGFLYPGHSRLRMHAPPSRTGSALMASLNKACEMAAITIVTQAHVTALVAAENGLIGGLCLQRPDGSTEALSCEQLILACNGYGAHPELLRQHIPEIAEALYFGHPGNEGDALLWGEALGAATRHLGAYQGHGSVATPHGILITWALMMEGGIQVNCQGRRFANEHQGYSEQAVAVLAQPGATAWNIFDERLHKMGLEFADYRHAWELGAIRTAATASELAALVKLPATELHTTLAQAHDLAEKNQSDQFGRSFTWQTALKPPYYAVQVTGALFHTQGGLVIDSQARVLRPDGTPFVNLLAAGGAACGLSGSQVSGYLSGNGLLSAVVLGRIAGQTAADSITGQSA